MNAYRCFVSSLAVLAICAGTASATPAVGTAKARGDYRPGAWATQRDGQSTYGRSYGYRSYYSRPFIGNAVPAPAIVQAPAASAATAPKVAQAPAAVRTFSYAPPAAVANSPCQPNTSGNATATNGRGYSYAPAIAPSQAAPVRRYIAPSYSRSTSGRATELWMLPKTDPRKYGGR